MGLFDKLKEPQFLKESSDAERYVEKLKTLEPLLTDEGRSKLALDIKMLDYGIIGEKNIAFELKNSHMPMYILHDIYLEHEGLSAQIDYMVFTRKLCFVIECKNLVGDIEITNAGDFIRTTTFGGYKKKEGIYSPITQNIRHLELLKKIRVDQAGNIVTKLLLNKRFEDLVKPIVVLANPKTILNAKFAKKEVKEQVIRADQLVQYIKNMVKQSKEIEKSDADILAWANRYLNFHIDKKPDYLQRYDQYRISTADTKPIVLSVKATSAYEEAVRAEANDPWPQIQVNVTQNQQPNLMPQQAREVTPSFYKTSENGNKSDSLSSTASIEETPLYKELRAFRLEQSRSENIKAYLIYNDSQMKDLISRMPTSREALLKIAGFNQEKANRYGDSILEIVKKYL